MIRTPLRRRSGLKPRQARFRAFEHQLALSRVALARRSEGFCEARTPVCRGNGAHAHHRLPRAHGGQNDLLNLLHTCWPCHSYIHQHPEESYGRGWMVRGGR